MHARCLVCLQLAAYQLAFGARANFHNLCYGVSKHELPGNYDYLETYHPMPEQQIKR